MSRLAALSLALLLPFGVSAQESARPTDDEALRSAAFAADSLRARRKTLVAALPAGAVCVLRAPTSAKDVAAYRPDPDFLYLSGVREPDLWMLLTSSEDLLFAPQRDRRAETWNGPRLAVGTVAAASSGFGSVVSRSRRAFHIKQALEKHGGPLFLNGVSLEELELGATEEEPLVRRLGPEIAKLRLVKSPQELALLDRACDITSAALLEVMASVRPGQFEYEVQAVIEYVFLRYGAQRPGFTSIVGSGPNSCVLHYNANRRRIQESELVVMDVGAEIWGYTADITRTVPSSGVFTKRQREIYELVLAAQKAGMEAVKPGSTLQAVDAAARKVIGDAGYGRHFAHFTSHWMGLDVHDVGSTYATLQPGMVLTVEPGVYLPDEQLGVRIEDDLLVTETGYRVLSDGVPRTVPEIEALMKGGGGAGARPVAPLPPQDEQAPGSTGSERRFFQFR